MTQILIQIPDEKDLTALLPLFERLGISVLKSRIEVQPRRDSNDEEDLLAFFDEIVQEDYEVFQKLAQ